VLPSYHRRTADPVPTAAHAGTRRYQFIESTNICVRWQSDRIRNARFAPWDYGPVLSCDVRPYSDPPFDSNVKRERGGGG